MPLSTSGFKELRNALKHISLFMLSGAIMATMAAFGARRPMAGSTAEAWLVNARPVIDGYTYRRIPDFERWLSAADTAPRLLILGPSTAYRGIIPSMIDSALGTNTFNAGSSSQSPEVSEALLARALAHTKLRWVLLDIDAQQWNEPAADEDRLDLIINNPYAVEYGPQLGLASPRLIGSWLYFSYKRWLYKRAGWQEAVGGEQPHSRYGGKGFVYSGLDGQPGSFPDTMLRPLLTSRTAGPVRRMQARCAAQGIRLILFYPKILNLEAGARYPAMPGLINGNCQTRLDTPYFYDAVHLRAAGARANTAFIIGQLQRQLVGDRH